MQWINKRDKKNRKYAHRLVNHFLNDAWDKENNCYVNCDFDTFKRLGRFKSLLYREQQGYCCYCMRKLDLKDRGKSTIEHVMPHKVEKKDVAYYYAHTPHLRKNVRVLLINKDTPRLSNLRPYPHFCAYENLVLSCSGAIYRTGNPEIEIASQLHECCNNPRGSKRVIPMFFIRGVAFEYNEDGTMDFPTEYEESIKYLRLETTNNLCLIRKCWAAIVKYYNISDVKRAITDYSLRNDILMDTTLEFHEAKRMKNDLYWQLLYEYRWFDGYFRNKKISN